MKIGIFQNRFNKGIEYEYGNIHIKNVSNNKMMFGAIQWVLCIIFKVACAI